MKKKKCLLAFGFLVAANAAMAFGPLSDCVWWFEGGKLGAGETERVVVSGSNDMLDLPNAGNPDGEMHKLLMRGDANGAKLVKGQVPVLALGMLADGQWFSEEQSYLSIPQNALGNGKYFPNMFVIPESVKEKFARDGAITVVARVRVTPNRKGGCYLFSTGYGQIPGSTGYCGAQVGFNVNTDMTKCDLYFWGRDNNGTGQSFISGHNGKTLDVNKWIDVAYVMKPGHFKVAVLDQSGSGVYWCSKEYPTMAFGMGSGEFRLGCGDSLRTGESSDNSSYFTGDIARFAVWNRELSDGEVLETFRWGSRDCVNVGIRNGSASEFAGETPSAGADEATHNWRTALSQAAPQLMPGEGWRYAFSVPPNKDTGTKKYAPSKVVQFALAADSASGWLDMMANGAKAGSVRARPGQTYAVVVESGLMNAVADADAANEIEIVSRTANKGKVVFDAIQVAGGWSFGYKDGNCREFQAATLNDNLTWDFAKDGIWREQEDKTADKFRWSQHYKIGRTFVFYVPEEAARVYGAKFSFNKPSEGTGLDNWAILDVVVKSNGAEKMRRAYSSESTLYEVDFAPGELKGGYNEIWVGTNYDPAKGRGWLWNDYFRFDWKAAKVYPGDGMILVVR